LEGVFEDLSEGHDYIMKAVEMMAALMTAQEAPVEVLPEDAMPEDVVPVAGRSISLRLARALINNTN
jgi:hypothetical protein